MGTRLATIFLIVLLVLIPATVLANVTIDTLTDEYRVSLGLNPLHTSDNLTDIARRRARQIVNDFSHDLSWGYNIGQSNLCAWGENLSYRIPAADHPATFAFDWWLTSDTHRALIEGDWTSTGSAVYLADNGGQYDAQLFVLRADPCPPGTGYPTDGSVEVAQP